jgi:hypothetical protein
MVSTAPRITCQLRQTPFSISPAIPRNVLFIAFESQDRENVKKILSFQKFRTAFSCSDPTSSLKL